MVSRYGGDFKLGDDALQGDSQRKVHGKAKDVGDDQLVAMVLAKYLAEFSFDLPCQGEDFTFDLFVGDVFADDSLMDPMDLRIGEMEVGEEYAFLVQFPGDEDHFVAHAREHGSPTHSFETDAVVAGNSEGQESDAHGFNDREVRQ